MPPRITSWINHEEFTMVMNLLFESEGDQNAQLFAVQRIKIWQKRSSYCPHEAESTASLMEILLRDNLNWPEITDSQSKPIHGMRPSHLELRLAYSMALIRFVNSLVDPLQTTYFAKSIASLASQLGLPLWFVELRHAATHEELPTLNVLRDGCRQALDWLYTNFWVPSATGITAQDPINSEHQVEAAASLLMSYKTLMKQIRRDPTIATKSQTELSHLYQGIDAWINGVSSESDGVRMLSSLLRKEGYMVPTGKKKRPSKQNPELPEDAEAVWMPLLNHLIETQEGFEEELISSLLEIICSETNFDQSYEFTLQAWLMYLLEFSDDDSHLDSVCTACLLSGSARAINMIRHISTGFPTMKSRIEPWLQVLESKRTQTLMPLATEQFLERLDIMEERMKLLNQALSNSKTTDKTSKAGAGWAVAASWTPRPIGHIMGSSHRLDLEY